MTSDFFYYNQNYKESDHKEENNISKPNKMVNTNNSVFNSYFYQQKCQQIPNSLFCNNYCMQGPKGEPGP